MQICSIANTILETRSLKECMHPSDQVPRRPVPVWNQSIWAYWTSLPSDCYFMCFQFSKPLYSLFQLKSIHLLYLLGRGLLAQSTESQDAQNNKNFLKCTMHKGQEESSAHEGSSSLDQEQDPEVFIQPSQVQLVPNMFMPYIEGPKMDWTVNDSLYQRFLQWCLKCENMLWVWACNVTWEKAMQEGNCFKWWGLAWTNMFLGASPMKT